MPDSLNGCLGRVFGFNGKGALVCHSSDSDMHACWGRGQRGSGVHVCATGLQLFGPAMKCPFPRVDVLIAGGAPCNTA